MIELLLMSCSAFFLLLIFYSVNKFINNRISIEERKLFHDKIDKFPSYLAVLEHYMNEAYRIIYNEKIMVYSLEASRLPENELNAAAKDYISLTLKFLGPKLEEEFANFYGNYDTFYFVIGQHFYSKYENDEVRETSTDNVMDYDTDYGENEQY